MPAAARAHTSTGHYYYGSAVSLAWLLIGRSVVMCTCHTDRQGFVDELVVGGRQILEAVLDHVVAIRVLGQRLPGQTQKRKQGRPSIVQSIILAAIHL